MTYYLMVRSDKQFSEDVPSSVLVEYLETESGLHRTDASSFGSRSGLPWLNVVIARGDPSGNYAAFADQLPQRVNLVQLNISSLDGSYPSALELAQRIADRLGWQVIDDETEEVLYTAPAN
ncbi:hypothetical protein ABT061_23420 [Streptosporangium sp. NPDC002544]|uniref:hypothetical protein n=1 Tax=Streptosporangium sp. NPDC002544 TaxID=3154538 RepID=UPI00332A56A7